MCFGRERGGREEKGERKRGIEWKGKGVIGRGRKGRGRGGVSFVHRKDTIPGFSGCLVDFFLAIERYANLSQNI